MLARHFKVFTGVPVGAVTNNKKTRLLKKGLLGTIRPRPIISSTKNRNLNKTTVNYTRGGNTTIAHNWWKGENKNVYEILSADSTSFSRNTSKVYHARKKRGKEGISRKI